MTFSKESRQIQKHLLHPSRRSFLGAGTVAALGFSLGRMKVEGFAESIRSAQCGSLRGDLGNGTYLNPVIAGDHPDAGAIRIGDSYYLTHTTFSYSPGLYIWHSTDLVNWTLVNAALKKYYGEVWAPYLCKYQGRYYIYFPCDGRLHVVYAKSPEGEWSEPVSLGIDGIDPAHIATPEGLRYLYFAGGKVVQLSADGLSVQGAPRKVFNAWPIPLDWRVECECLEGPKVFYRDGYYYLTVAEGGTSGPPTSHMVISARSRNIDGPWEYSPFNPIVHTRSKAERWWSKGHGRLVEAADHSWWMTCHAYENGYRSLGRQLLLLPVEWTSDGWYRIPAGVSASQPLAIPRSAAIGMPSKREEKHWPNVGLEWQFWKPTDPNRLRLDGDALLMKANGDSIANSSVMACIAGDHSYTVEVDIEIEPGCEAGLVLFYNQQHFVGISMRPSGLELRPQGDRLAPATRAKLRIVNDDQEVDCYYQLPGKTWTKFQNSFDITCYNQNAMAAFWMCGQLFTPAALATHCSVPIAINDAQSSHNGCDPAATSIKLHLP